MDVDEPTAKAVGGEILPMIFVVSKAIEYIKNQILDRVVSRVTSRHVHVMFTSPCLAFMVILVSSAPCVVVDVALRVPGCTIA